jgi:serine/threonine protein kinase
VAAAYALGLLRSGPVVATTGATNLTSSSAISAKPVIPAAAPSTLPADSLEPRYVDELVQRLRSAEDRKQALIRCGEDIDTIDSEIRDLKRELREGGQLKKGDSLDDGRFVLCEQIGRGGFGTVWRARDRENHEFVAIKVLHSELAGDKVRRRRFFRGAKTMAELAHPSVVRVLQPYGEDGGYHFFVMEFVTGGDMRHAVLEKRLRGEDVIAVILQVGGALALAHARGLTHRDVKPENILMDASFVPRLTDFDLVVGDKSTTGGTRTGAMGSLFYTSPEMMDRPQDADARADVFSLGMTTVFGLYGAKLPYEIVGNNSKEYIDRLPCSEPIKAMLKQAVAWDHSARFANAAAFCEALREASTRAAVIKASPPGIEPASMDLLSSDPSKAQLQKHEVSLVEASKNEPAKQQGVKAEPVALETPTPEPGRPDAPIAEIEKPKTEAANPRAGQAKAAETEPTKVVVTKADIAKIDVMQEPVRDRDIPRDDPGCVGTEWTRGEVPDLVAPRAHERRAAPAKADTPLLSQIGWVWDRSEAIDGEIDNPKRRLREGGQLKKGDSLDDGRFVLCEQVGRGGFGTVWRARDLKSREFVAIKILHNELASDEVQLQRFFWAAKKMAELAHPSVVRVLKPHGKDGDYHFFVMEFVTGGDMRRWVLDHRLGRDDIIRAILQVGEALALAHAKGLVHGDVKPANILLDGSFVPRLTEFDLVHYKNTTGGARYAGMGSIIYRAPEMMSGPQNADARADVFGLGMTTVFGLYGAKLPSQIVGNSKGYIEQLPTGLIDGLVCSESIKTLLRVAVHWNPAARFVDAAGFCKALQLAKLETPRKAWTVKPAKTEPTPRKRNAVKPNAARVKPAKSEATETNTARSDAVQAEPAKTKTSLPEWKLPATRPEASGDIIAGLPTASRPATAPAKPNMPPAPSPERWDGETLVGCLLLIAIVFAVGGGLAWGLNRLFGGGPEPASSVPPPDSDIPVSTRSSADVWLTAATATANAASDAVPGPVNAADLPRSMAYVTITWPKEGTVYFDGQFAGRAGERVQTTCGLKFARLAKDADGPAAQPMFLTTGKVVNIPCQAATSIALPMDP